MITEDNKRGYLNEKEDKEEEEEGRDGDEGRQVFKRKEENDKEQKRNTRIKIRQIGDNKNGQLNAKRG